MNFQPVFMFPQSSMTATPAVQHIVYHAPDVGFWAVSDIVPDLLSPEELAIWQDPNNEPEAYHEEPGAEPVPAFALVEDVIAWANAMDAIASLDEDPILPGSDCGDIAYRSIEARLEEVMKRAVGLVPEAILAIQCN